MRKIALGVYDYRGNKLVDLYSNTCACLGEAYDVEIKRELDGNKELSFTIPARILDANGQWMDNPRRAYLRNEYIIRLTDSEEPEKWDEYMLSEPTETRTGEVLEIEVSCEHVSKRLAQKNLFLTLEDTGSGVGTARELLTRILDGTGWKIGRMSAFLEADGKTEKVRTLTGSRKTGAYRLITQLAELFGASPVFHGRSRTIDLLTEVGGDLGVEFRYSKNLQNVQRTCVSDHICTRLYVDYLESEQGYIGIERVNPLGTSFLLDFSYMEHLGLMTGEQLAFAAGYAKALRSNAQLLQPLISLQVQQENVLNELAGQSGIASLTVQTLGDGSYQWQTADSYLLTDDWTVPEGAEVYCRGESTVWQPFPVKSYDKNARVLTFDGPTEAGITRMIWFETPPAGTLGSLLMTLAARKKVLENLRSKLASETSEARKAVYQQNIDKILNEVTALYADTEDRSGITSSFAYLLEAIPALCQTMETVNHIREAQDALTAEFEDVMGDLLKDGVYDGKDYSSDQEEALYQDALEELGRRCYPEVEYDCDAVVLSEAAGFEMETVHIGDRVRILDRELGIDDIGYVTEMVFRPGSHEPPKIAIGNYLRHYTDYFARVLLTTQEYQNGKKIYDRASIIQPDGTLDSKALEQSLRGADVNAGAGDSVHMGDDGVIVTNPLDPNGSQLKLVDGALYASQDGGLTWTLVLDGNGISPDMLAQGVLDSGRLTIMDGDSRAFVWNSTGLYALHPQYPEKRWIRYSKDGIVFTQDGGETYDFQISWDGVLFRRNGVYMSMDAIVHEITTIVSDAVSSAMQEVTPEKSVSTVRTSREYQGDLDQKASNTQLQNARAELSSSIAQTADNVTATFQRIGLAGGQTGIVKADIDGVTVSMQDGDEVVGSSRLGAEGLTIYDAAGNARADFGSGDKAWIKRLVAEDIDCPSMLKTMTGTGVRHIYLAPAPTGDGSGRDTSNKSNSLNSALLNVIGTARHIPFGMEVQVHVAEGTYQEQISITGYFGGGSLHVIFESANVVWYSSGSHFLMGNSISIIFSRSGLTTQNVSNADSLTNTAQMIVSQTRSNIFTIDACRYVQISGIRTRHSSNQTNNNFVAGLSGSRISIVLCDISNCNYVAHATSCSYIATRLCCGSLHDGWMFVDDGGQVCRDAGPFCPAVIGSNSIPGIVLAKGAFIPVGGADPADTVYTIEASRYNPNGAFSGSQPTPQVVSTTIYASEYVSTRRGGAETKMGICYAGNYFDASGNPYPKYTGYARFYGVSAWCSGASNISMRLFVQRLQTSHGKGSGARPCLLLPDGTEWAWSVGLARNGNMPTSTWITLPPALVSFLAAGGNNLGETLTFYASSTNDYIQYATNMVLEITATKTL